MTHSKQKTEIEDSPSEIWLHRIRRHPLLVIFAAFVSLVTVGGGLVEALAKLRDFFSPPTTSPGSIATSNINVSETSVGDISNSFNSTTNQNQYFSSYFGQVQSRGAPIQKEVIYPSSQTPVTQKLPNPTPRDLPKGERDRGSNTTFNSTTTSVAPRMAIENMKHHSPLAQVTEVQISLISPRGGGPLPFGPVMKAYPNEYYVVRARDKRIEIFEPTSQQLLRAFNYADTLPNDVFPSQIFLCQKRRNRSVVILATEDQTEFSEAIFDPDVGAISEIGKRRVGALSDRGECIYDRK